MNVFVGIPCYDKVSPEVLEDYNRMMFYFGRRYPEVDFFMGIKTKSEQFRARNSLIEAAYQMGSDYLLMLDDDHIFDTRGGNYPSEAYEYLRRFLAHMQNDPKLGLVGGLYYHRGGECRPVVLRQNGDGKYIYLRDDEIKKELQEVDVQGGGCMLIRMKALDHVSAPWFEPETEFGTDFQICRKLKQKGWKIACDTSIEIGHLIDRRQIVTSNNRHLFSQEMAGLSDDMARNARLIDLMERFRNDVMEFLGLENYVDLVALAEQYVPHRARFGEYAAENRIQDYYTESGKSYLARSCFVHQHGKGQNYFDDFVLKSIKADVPGQGMDFGCCAAPISFELALRGQRIWFYDLEGTIPFEFVKWRAKKYEIYGKNAMFSKEFPPPNTLDYALFLDSIEHLEDWQTPLRKAGESLKENGCIITNYMILQDGPDKNPEHIFWDKSAFMRYMTEIKLWPINNVIFQKQSEFGK